jgi:hypothetical protein
MADRPVNEPAGGYNAFALRRNEDNAAAGPKAAAWMELRIQ